MEQQQIRDAKIAQIIDDVIQACKRPEIHVHQPPLVYALEKCDLIHRDGMWCAEFGVFMAGTLQYIRDHTPQSVPVFGFDTFTGLPDQWREGFPAGVFALSDGLPVKFPNNTIIAKGLFQETLEPLMSIVTDAPLRLLHVDCDIYSAAKFVLYSLNKNIVQGTIIVFDELMNYPGFEQHELRAFAEFVADHDRTFEVVAMWQQDSEQVAVRITN